MKPGGGKEKGAEFERLVCKELSMWITDGKSKDVFWRSASSGGRSTFAFNRGGAAKTHQSSDISPIGPEAYRLLNIFSIECKVYSSLKINQLAYVGLKSPISEFWDQTIRDAERVSKQPMLIAKESRNPVLVGLRPDTYEEFRAMYRRKPHLFPRALISTSLKIALCDFKSFLSIIKPDDLDKLK